MPQPESPSGSKLPAIVAQSQTRSQLQLKFNPNHRAQAMAWVLVPARIMTGIVVQRRQTPLSRPTLQHWKYLCTSKPFNYFVWNFSPSEEQCCLSIDNILGLQSGQSFMWKQELPETFILTGYDAEKRSFKGGETMLQEQLRVITDSPWMCASIQRLTSVTQRENKQWAVWWEDRKHNT